jgi:putative nucleotide binding protein
MSDSERDDSGPPGAVVLDFLAHGRTEDDRPQYQKQPLAYALGRAEFRLFEAVLGPDADVSIGDDLVVDRGEDHIERVGEVEYDDLPSGAQSELEYAVEDVVADEERRFVDFYNDAQPITLRLHQLNLLPGIGKKLRNSILDERKRRPFDSFDDLQSRVDGLHSPREVVVERILEEIREDDLKYQTFARRDGES